ncbi:hypothetical protein [Zooshikella sp. RANM57]|uniref:hypothetical protein n=1 Tax=Zooshikella sp. RANM57 TaxID=3425863 RepID=UPI003D6EF9EF
MAEPFFNVNGTWKSLDTAYVNVNGTWKETDVYVNVNGTWKLVSLKRVAVGGGANFDLFGAVKPLIGSAGNIEITLNGTYQATATTHAALGLSNALAGRKVRIINNGLIIGKEGVGGPGQWQTGSAGASGGTAIWIDPHHGCRSLEFYNNPGARVYAGGGGGGGGGGVRIRKRIDDSHKAVESKGGHGGRGAGSGGGATGGGGGTTDHDYPLWSTGGTGGTGGNYGTAGGHGGAGYGYNQSVSGNFHGGGAGGAAGIAIHNVGTIKLTGYTDTSRIVGRRI